MDRRLTDENQLVQPKEKRLKYANEDTDNILFHALPFIFPFISARDAAKYGITLVCRKFHYCAYCYVYFEEKDVYRALSYATRKQLSDMLSKLKGNRLFLTVELQLHDGTDSQHFPGRDKNVDVTLINEEMHDAMLAAVSLLRFQMPTTQRESTKAVKQLEQPEAASFVSPHDPAMRLPSHKPNLDGMNDKNNTPTTNRMLSCDSSLYCTTRTKKLAPSINNSSSEPLKTGVSVMDQLHTQQSPIQQEQGLPIPRYYSHYVSPRVAHTPQSKPFTPLVNQSRSSYSPHAYSSQCPSYYGAQYSPYYGNTYGSQYPPRNPFPPPYQAPYSSPFPSSKYQAQHYQYGYRSYADYPPSYPHPHQYYSMPSPSTHVYHSPTTPQSHSRVAAHINYQSPCYPETQVPFKIKHEESSKQLASFGRMQDQEKRQKSLPPISSIVPDRLNQKPFTDYSLNPLLRSRQAELARKPSPEPEKASSNLVFKTKTPKKIIKIPSSKNPIDVLNYMINERMLFLMTLTKLKPNKGSTKSPNGMYWEIANMKLAVEGYEPLVIRSGNKGTNDNGSHNRIRYALYAMIPPSEEDIKAVIDGTYTAREDNLVRSMDITITAKRYDDNVEEAANKIIVDSVKIFKCDAAILIEDTRVSKMSTQASSQSRSIKNGASVSGADLLLQAASEQEKKVIPESNNLSFLSPVDDAKMTKHSLPVYFVYAALRYDISQDTSKSLTHILQIRHKGQVVLESSRVKFVSGRQNPNCVLSKKTHSWEQEMVSYDIKLLSNN